VLVRRPGALERAFSMFPEYLRDVGVAGDEVAFRDRGPQLSRGTRALKLWLSMQVFGLDAFRAAIDRGIDLAEQAERLAAERFKIVTPAQLAILTFRVPDADGLAARATADGYVVPSTTVLRGETVLRMCTINPRTTDQELAASVERLALLSAWPPT
jgi:glutamate/tyrosine decarboxylase-like PLP-dependent enzyme